MFLACVGLVRSALLNLRVSFTRSKHFMTQPPHSQGSGDAMYAL